MMMASLSRNSVLQSATESSDNTCICSCWFSYDRKIWLWCGDMASLPLLNLSKRKHPKSIKSNRRCQLFSSNFDVATLDSVLNLALSVAAEQQPSNKHTVCFLINCKIPENNQLKAAKLMKRGYQIRNTATAFRLQFDMNVLSPLH